MKNDRNALYAAHVKLSRPNTTPHIVKAGPETVWSTLVNDTSRRCGAVGVVIDTPLVRRSGVVASWQRVQRHLI